jgi:excinuclease ABC subunit A
MDACQLRGVRTHNLKGIDLSIPFGRLTVITGVSGSGKSSLAFDTIYAEGQRRFVDCLATYARQFLERLDRPDADSIGRLEPPLALKQTTSVRNARSTVGSMTEISDHLQLLFAHAGEQHCLACGAPVVPETIETAADRLLSRAADQAVCVVAPVTRDRLGSTGVRGLLAQGYTRTLRAGGIVDWPDAWIAGEGPDLPDSIDVVVDRFPRSRARRARAVEAVGGAWRLGQGRAALYSIETEGPVILRDQLREGAVCCACGTVGETPSRSLFSPNNPIGACSDCQGFGRTVVIDPAKVVPDPRRTLRNDAILPFRMPSRRGLYRRMIRLAPEAKVRTEVPWRELTERERRWVFEGGRRYPGVLGLFARLEKKRYKMHVRILLARFRGYVPCASCGGTRLKAAALSVRIGGRNLAEIAEMPIATLRAFFDDLRLPAAREARVGAVLREIRVRLRCLDDVGLGYLSLGRTARTLSGGETQRLRLASGMGASLTRTLYILDEPTVGLHARDASRVLDVLRRICGAGNTAIVVEHDPAVVDGADHLIVLGPEGGEKGGELLFEGPPADFLEANPGFFRVARPAPRPAPAGAVPKLVLRGLTEHNLKIEELAIPLYGLIAVSGVSGSGKSTLLDEVVYRNGRRFRGLPVEEVGAARSIDGYDTFDEVLLIGQDPLGRSTRSNAVSFVKVLPLIRDLFARTPDAKERRLRPRDFSFNVPGGRCEICKGIGTVVLEMHFLPDVEVACEACKGRRFRQDVLEVAHRGRTITGVLDLTADEAAAAFADHPEIARRLRPLQEVGLGYLRLGQPTSTLSGGEAQRLKLASFLAERPSVGRRLFLFDEPTTGLHARDIARLLGALRLLTARGDVVIVVEHHLDFLCHADWNIDLGPGPGDEGGRVVYEGPIDGMIRCAASFTGKALAAHLRAKRPARAARSRS